MSGGQSVKSAPLRPLIAALLLLGTACSDTPRPGVAAENLVLVTFEGMRADHLSALTYPRPTGHIESGKGLRSLDIDWMAESGVLFSEAQSPSPEPRAALASVMTGVSPLTHGLLAAGGQLASDVTTLAEQLADQGFHCAAFVAPSVRLTGSGLQRGFHSWDEGDDDVALSQRAITWLKNDRPEDQPLFLWLHLQAAVPPFDVPALPEQPELANTFMQAGGVGRVHFDADFLEVLRGGEFSISHLERQALIARHDAEIRRANLQMSKLFRFYKYSNLEGSLWEKTLVAICGVGGSELGERSSAWHLEQSLFEEALHVPLILRHPASITGRRIEDTVVELTDLHPTLLELFELNPSKELEGRTLLPLIDSYVKRDFEQHAAVSLRLEPTGVLGVSLRTPGLRMVLEDAGGPGGIYDLQEDPAQKHDLSGERLALRSGLRAQLIDRLKSTAVSSEEIGRLRDQFVEAIEARTRSEGGGSQ